MANLNNLTKTIVISVELEVPAGATQEDIQDFIDVEYGECNGMKPDNPCKRYEILEYNWQEA
ncbi:hypothetical protein [Pectobacterium carotovorum]|uniref:hypothetical protein n=1 Tax=Pectobacterium carotovorum TaxID=554 RepID=UPI0020898135|nr:hypothetical protein [Pectobacterium carotovorum]GKV88166.1 hypothetical protein PEC301619_01480 [Pectobacterium carotovorum subsp. carotovorum]